eukprot:2896363-Prymnesium_polylepis.1
MNPPRSPALVLAKVQFRTVNWAAPAGMKTPPVLVVAFESVILARSTMQVRGGGPAIIMQPPK